MKKVVGYKGKITFDSTKPDGAPRKLIDVTRLTDMGWKYSTSLENGLSKIYKWYLINYLQKMVCYVCQQVTMLYV